MEKVMVGKMPASAFPVAIVGAMVDGKANFNTLGCYGLISMIRPMVFIMSGKSHYTNVGIHETGYFSVNIPSADLVKKTDYVGIVSGKDTDKSGVFSVFLGGVDKAPLAEECPVNMVCKVIKSEEMSNGPNSDIISEVFFGEVLEVHVSKECMTDGKPDIKKIDPLLLGGSEVSYWGLGNKVGVAFREGRSLK